ncbi:MULTISPECIES: kynureninase [unclassified Roseitalea]|uniref:kynureninase n=1 Tax=unclassified Roseitalea TaxID=2639107 RepID=UPI00273D8D2B|nr:MULTISPECIES: kynureninase [unclassified Roseitalea]
MTDDIARRARELDGADPLAPMRNRFDLPANLVYLDGNSLGPLTKSARARVRETVDTAWGEHLITAWNRDGWADLPARIGARIARLIGAAPGTVRAGDSTSVNLFKVLSAAISLKGGDATILSDTGNFPTDLYVAQGLAGRFDGVRLRLVEPEEVAEAIDDRVDIVMLTEVDYRTGRKHDMAALTELAHAQGALAIWDLAHSAGAFPVALDACGADFAVGCGYKYLNGGPGAPAFYHVAERHQQAIDPLLAGWFGHAAPFAFDLDYRPADGIDRLRVGTPPVLSMAALDASLDVFDNADLAAIADKSARLTQFFIDCVDGFAAQAGLTLATPRAAAERGSHVSWRHEHAYPVMQALIARGVIGDMRAPDIVRFGFAPLYNSFAEVARAAGELETILRERAWDRPEFHRRNAVT